MLFCVESAHEAVETGKPKIFKTGQHARKKGKLVFIRSPNAIYWRILSWSGEDSLSVLDLQLMGSDPLTL